MTAEDLKITQRNIVVAALGITPTEIATELGERPEAISYVFNDRREAKRARANVTELVTARVQELFQFTTEPAAN